MKRTLKLLSVLPIASIATMINACTKDDETPCPQFDVITLKHSKPGDTATYNLTIESGHRELPQIITPVKHGNFSSISRDPNTGWYFYKYVPTDGFTGADSIVLRSSEPVDRLTLYTHITFIVYD